MLIAGDNLSWLKKIHKCVKVFSPNSQTHWLVTMYVTSWHYVGIFGIFRLQNLLKTVTIKKKKESSNPVDFLQPWKDISACCQSFFHLQEGITQSWPQNYFHLLCFFHLGLGLGCPWGYWIKRSSTKFTSSDWGIIVLSNVLPI